MTIEMIREREMLEQEAFRIYGEFLGRPIARTYTKQKLIEKFELTEAEAEELAQVAFEEWMAVYE